MNSKKRKSCEIPTLLKAPFKRTIGVNEARNRSSNILKQQSSQLHNSPRKEIDISKNTNLHFNLKINQHSKNLFFRKHESDNQGNDQIETFRINYKTWKWQPNINLDRLKPNQQSAKIVDGFSDVNVPVSPIEFDSDESFIREMSPETAEKRFRQRMKNIKQSTQQVEMKSNSSNTKRVKKVLSAELIEYEKIHKRLQNKKKKNKRKLNRSGGRRLYNHNESMDISEKENSIKIENDVKSKRKQVQLSQHSVRSLPQRAAKNNALSKILN